MANRLERNTVLMVGFHFPPSALSSGHLRLLAFAKYLPQFGWNPVILTASQCAYENVDRGSVRSIPGTCPVYRAVGFDAKRHFALRGKYPAILAQPDRWSSWWPAAVWRGLQLVRRYRPRVLWSTYPIMTSHCVAYTLSRLTGLPWIADFRDPVVGSVAGKDPRIVRSQVRWERRVIMRADCSVFTALSAMRACAERYPTVAAGNRFVVIENGYDETMFDCVPHDGPDVASDRLLLVHSGALYPEGRNPGPFFHALAELRDAGEIEGSHLQVILRASGATAPYADTIERLAIGDIVKLEPQIPAAAALQEQARADGLLLFQGTLYDQHIPAKVYEYLRVGKPIFALVGSTGDTAALLRNTGGAQLVPLDDVDAITNGLRAFLHALHDGTADRVQPAIAARYSRCSGAASLARLLAQTQRSQP